MQPVTIEDLKSVVALSDLPDEHLQWILDRSEYYEYTDGDLISKYGDSADTMWISLMGKITFYMYINGRQVYYFTFENDNVTGGIGGVMPYSRMKTIPGYSYALGDVKLLRIHKKYFTELEQLNPDFIQRLIGYMTNRAKAFATTQLQYEKVNALGNLAAGIAHEFNNPAAAISEISDELANRISRNYELTKKLLECKMTPQHLQNIRTLLEKKENGSVQAVKRTTLQRIENEDEMEKWLEKNGIAGREMAETFSEYGFSTQELENIRIDVGTASFTSVIPWLENVISSQKIIKDLADASRRISNLVASIKSHVHMDRTNDLQPTNIHRDIENTLTLLGFKLREKNIKVNKRFCQNMPDVPAYVGELNQVWTNLIDNAIFALEKNGSLTIETSCDDKNIRVSIIDNGGGIPKEIMSQIFDPFFTTKKMGEGTGIGLDIVNRVVKRHKGDIKVTSEPGRTEFSVCIPLVQPSASN
ncbi:MAG: GHKL domain-containing protein [Flavisolibacter sp.]|nr:GHKL domain-containing protein [Flavisolibacter sp.]